MSKHSSKLLKAMKGWNEALQSYSEPPKGMFNRRAIVESWAVKIDSDELDLEFDVSCDNDLEANEISITVYNLSQNTIKNIIVGKPVSITAGYKNDTGVIAKGIITKVKTKKDGVDKVTTITAIDSMGLEEKDIAEVTYAKGTTASYILKDLICKTHLPIAVFEPKRTWKYENEITVSGGLMENIKKYSEVCGISTFINQGKVYAMELSKGKNGYFNLSADTGLIGSVEENQETIQAEDYNDTITVLNAKCLLQHRITVASVVNLQSENYKGEYRVRKVVHTFNETEATSELELI